MRGPSERRVNLERKLRLLRFWNNDVLKNREGVLQVIAGALEAKL